MKRQQLRPLSIGETIDAVFTIYRSHFVVLITIVAVVLVPILLLQGILELAFINNLVETDPEDITSLGDIFSPGAVVASFLLGLLGWAANALASGAVVKAVSDTYLGREPDWRQSIQFALTKLAPLMLGSLLFGIGVAFGLVLLIVPGIILAVSWAVFAPAIIIEDAGATGGLGRSWQLIGGRRWPVFGTFVVLYVIILVVSAIFSLILGGLLQAGSGGDYTFGNTILDIVVGVLTAPLLAIATVVVYFDLRVRKEAFDVQLLAQQIGEPAPPVDPGMPDTPPPTPPEDPGSAWPPPSDP